MYLVRTSHVASSRARYSWLAHEFIAHYSCNNNSIRPNNVNDGSGRRRRTRSTHSASSVADSDDVRAKATILGSINVSQFMRILKMWSVDDKHCGCDPSDAQIHPGTHAHTVSRFDAHGSHRIDHMTAAFGANAQY